MYNFLKSFLEKNKYNLGHPTSQSIRLQARLPKKRFPKYKVEINRNEMMCRARRFLDLYLTTN